MTKQLENVAACIYTDDLYASFLNCADFRDPVQGSISLLPLSNYENPCSIPLPVGYCFVPP